jgi:hypothetical protein
MVKEAEIMVDMGIPPPSIPSLDFSFNLEKNQSRIPFNSIIFLYAFVSNCV